MSKERNTNLMSLCDESTSYEKVVSAIDEPREKVPGVMKYTVPCKEAPSSKVGHGETVHNLDETGGLEHEDTKSGAPTLGKDTGPREEKLSMRAQGYTEETGTGE